MNIFSLKLLAFLLPAFLLFASCAEQEIIESYNPEIDKLFQEWNTESSPGCALAVIKDGEIMCSRGYGIADLDRRLVPCVFGREYDDAIVERIEVFFPLIQHVDAIVDDDARIRDFGHHTRQRGEDALTRRLNLHLRYDQHEADGHR